MENVTGQLVLDGDVAKVTEFIEKEVGSGRRVFVAERLAEVARLIWADTRCALFASRDPLPSASELHPAGMCAGDDSAAVGDNLPLR